MDWLWVCLNHATFGLEVEDNVITGAPPIAKWTEGKRVEEILPYYKRKGAKILSDEDNGFPGVQLSTFVKNDQLVFRAPDGEALKTLLQSVATNGNDILDALLEVKQVVIAKNVITSSESQGGAKANGAAAGAAKPAARKATGARAKDAPPPSGDVTFFEGEDGKNYASIECSHGPMLDLRGSGFKSDLYCTLDTKDWKAKCKPVSL